MKNTPWKEYLTFTRKERNAVAVLSALIIAFCLLPWFFRPVFEPPTPDTTLLQQLAATNPQETVPLPDTIPAEVLPVPGNPEQNGLQPFPFDPNTINASGLKQLGLRDKTIQTLLNYRNKGGRFKTPGDIRKIYGLRPDEADALIPYITISPTSKEVVHTEQPATAISLIDINHASAAELETLPGIGAVLSNRIVKFRTAINGFATLDDLKRTYGLSDSVYRVILPLLTITPYEQDPEE